MNGPRWRSPLIAVAAIIACAALIFAMPRLLVGSPASETAPIQLDVPSPGKPRGSKLERRREAGTAKRRAVRPRVRPARARSGPHLR